MKQLIHTTILGSIIISSSTSFALNPVQGFYGGVMLGGSYTPTISHTITDPTTNTKYTGKLQYSGYGDIGGQIGYRVNDYRAELEGFYNYSPYNKISLNGYTITSQKFKTGRDYIEGYTGTASIMVNGYFDFFPFVGQEANFVPYVGLGVGYSNIQNSIRVINNGMTVSGTNISGNKGSVAGQGIIGASYFLDDFTVFALDYRYYSSKSTYPFNARTRFQAVNIIFNGAFDL